MFDNPVKSVRAVTHQSTERVASQQLVNMAPVKLFMVRYGDASGNSHTTLAFQIGNQWYMDPNAEEWASRMRPVSEWLGKQLNTKLSALAAPVVPPQDEVVVVNLGDEHG